MIEQIIVNGIVAGSVYILAGLSFGIIFTTTGVFHFAMPRFTPSEDSAFIRWRLPGRCPSFSLFLRNRLCGVIRGAHRAGLLSASGRASSHPRANFSHRVDSRLSCRILLCSSGKVNLWSCPFPRNCSRPTTGSIRVTYFQIITIAVVAVLWGALHVFMGRSKMGKAIRAFAADPKTSELMGMDTKTLRLLIFLIGSALIALAAALQIMDFGMDTTTGLGVALLGFIATLIGAGWGLTGIGFISLALESLRTSGWWCSLPVEAGDPLRDHCPAFGYSSERLIQNGLPLKKGRKI